MDISDHGDGLMAISRNDSALSALIFEIRQNIPAPSIEREQPDAFCRTLVIPGHFPHGYLGGSFSSL
jgi:hypothetical protein